MTAHVNVPQTMHWWEVSLNIIIIMCVASVFVEKLLREVPDVQKIFLLVRAKNEEAAMQRLKTEVSCFNFV